MIKKRKKKISPYVKIILWFLIPLLAGSLLLVLPIATKTPGHLPYIDALFLATSSICVTGLSTVEVGSTLTVFGQSVMAILIEIGGFSFLTVACFILLFVQKKLDYATQSLMKEALNRDSMSGIKILIKRIVIFSLTVQGVGVLIDLGVLIPSLDDVGFAVRCSVFHAISAYNNAGFDIFGTGDSLVSLTASMSPVCNVFFKLNTMALIVVGGIGYIFIGDCWEKKRWKKLRINTKIVFIMAGALILVGGLLLKLFVVLDGRDVSLLECFFLSVSSRTAGFDNVGLSDFPGAGYALIIFLMYVGASPCSTGGGVKTTTLFVVIMVILSFIRGKEPSFGYRKLSSSSILKTFILIAFSILYIFVALVILLVAEGNRFSLSAVLFEVVSAFSTTGLSTGITSALSHASKVVLCVTMFLGRVGVLTFLSVINKSWLFDKTEQSVRYIEENIIIG